MWKKKIHMKEKEDFETAKDEIEGSVQTHQQRDL